VKSTTTTSTKIITIVNRLACSSLESLWGIFYILVFLAPNPTASSREILESNPKKTSEYREFEFIKRYCLECHSGEKPKASLDLSRFDSMDKILSEALLWDDILIRLSQGDMPPKEADLPTLNERSEFLNWVESSLQKAACQSGPHAGPAVLRRLNRAEYSASVRDLLDIHFDAGEALPSDGSGGEGFDNASETLFISPIHAEKYMDAARVAVEYAFADPRSLRRFLVAEPDEKTSPEVAARRVIEDFLPRAFRRSIPESEILEYLALFHAAYKADPSFMVAIRLTLQAVLISPKFLFIAEEPNFDSKPHKVTDHELASRLSYFLWGSLPDDELLKAADEGNLSDSRILQEQFKRMLGSQNSRKVRNFSQNFVEQWLGTRALGREFKPDKSIRGYDSELEGGMKYEPVFFFHEILTENRSLLDLLKADYTYVNRRLARHYRIKGEFREQPKRVQLTDENRRGGLLSMAAVLAVSSYPHRTSPVLRGKWILETILGDPPPPPPSNVPELEESASSVSSESLRQRLELHRQDVACAQCHDRIDPLGFGLENYGVLGRWRDKYEGHTVDARGALPDGTTFSGPAELKLALLGRKDQFVRHLTKKMLGYALGRGLTYYDYCAVNSIVDKLRANDYKSHHLLFGIIQSVPFRFKAGIASSEAERASTLNQDESIHD
jgi:hypothetical protein|tara:strand:- start:3589 stop:5601 length:2013 start_codon:yes stop_codon:yes gene_type:complete